MLARQRAAAKVGIWSQVVRYHGIKINDNYRKTFASAADPTGEWNLFLKLDTV
jgi:hypothetical protein